MPDDLLSTLSYGLRFNTVGKPHRLGSDVAAQLAAEMLVQHLEQSGFVIMRKPPAHAAIAASPPFSANAMAYNAATRNGVSALSPGRKSSAAANGLDFAFSASDSVIFTLPAPTCTATAKARASASSIVSVRS